MQVPGGPSADSYVDRCTLLLCRSVVWSHSLRYSVTTNATIVRTACGNSYSVMQHLQQRVCYVAGNIPWFAYTLGWQSAAVQTRHPASPLMLCGSQKASEMKYEYYSSPAHLKSISVFFFFFKIKTMGLQPSPFVVK